MARDICIDLGTSNTVITEKNKGVILCEPTVAAVDNDTGKILAAGAEARALQGKTPTQISVVSPVKSGVIAEFDVACAMLGAFLEGIVPRGALRPKACVCLPQGITQVEKNTLLEVVSRSGAKSTYTIMSPIASALGAGLEVSEPVGNMILDVGGGKTCASVVSFGGIVTSVGIPYGGKKMDECIVEYIKKTFNVRIGEKTAEKIKINIGTGMLSESEKSLCVTGRSEKNGLPAEICVTEAQMYEALLPQLLQIAELIERVLENTPAELTEDLSKNGIHLCGGGAKLFGLSAFLEEHTGFFVTLCDEAHLCTARGAQAMFDAGKAQ